MDPRVSAKIWSTQTSTDHHTHFEILDRNNEYIVCMDATKEGVDSVLMQ